MRLPAVCDNCGTIFPSPFNFSNTTNVTIKGPKVGPCPTCGGKGQVIDGKFDFIGSTINVKCATPETLRILEILKQAGEAARNNRPHDEIIDKIGLVSPEAAKQAETLYKIGGKFALIIMISVLISSCTHNTEGKIDWNVLFDQIKVAIFGGKPYPGLANLPEKTSSITEDQQEQTAQPKKPSSSDDKSSNSQKNSTNARQTTRPETNPSEGKPGIFAKLRKPKNREVMRQKRAEHRRQMRGCSMPEKSLP